MRINFDTVIHDADFNSAKEDGKVMTVRDVVRRALVNTHPDESKKLSEEDKCKRFLLACKVHEAQVGDDFEAYETKEMLTATNLWYGTLIYGQVNRALSKDEAPLLERMQPNGNYRDKPAYQG